MKQFVLVLSAFSLLAGAAAPALAAKPCRDKAGKFVKCATVKPKVCRDTKGHFVKCAK